MHWDRLFEDLEGQLASEWEAERAALSAESERLRISRLDLRDRLRMLCADAAAVILELVGGERVPVRLRDLGADWVGAETAEEGAGRARSLCVVPIDAIAGLTMDHGMLLSSLEERDAAGSALRERMTFGFVMRDLARRRVPVRLALRQGGDVHGTVDRAGADHLDLAVHDAGEVRRAGAVHEFRILPFASVLWLRAGGEAQLP